MLYKNEVFLWFCKVMKTNLRKFMSAGKINKRKIFNDPVYGFISITDDLIFDIIEHPYFQRLRRIKQLGLTHLVYPGALHTRFHHSLGAMHLMGKALNELKMKGYKISKKEFVSAQIAMLLHDIGHGPYSHALEHSIVDGVNHEKISILFMHRLNTEFKGKLNLAIDIFENNYSRKFFHHLVTSQFDMDRLDYLKRDSFFTGVSEGIINYERLLNMLEIANDRPVIEYKGIYSVEKFITARRLMYWQVYLHKTVLSAEYMAFYLLKRAKELSLKGVSIFSTPALKLFLEHSINENDFINDKKILDDFACLDDYDIYSSMKVWQNHADIVLSTLSKGLVNRHLFKIELQNEPFNPEKVHKVKNAVLKHFKISQNEINYFVFEESTSNYTYKPGVDKINLLFKNGSIMDISEASDQLSINTLSKPTVKYFLCYPKDIVL